MAAIFCNSLCKPCEWLNRQCSKCCNNCCKTCDEQCAECCSCFVRCTASACSAFGHCLDSCCVLFDQVCTKPFSLCVVFTFLVNLVPLGILSYFLATSWEEECRQPLELWVAVMIPVWLINILFSIYTWRQVANMDLSQPAEPGNGPYDKAMKFFMYDPWVCIYIVVVLFEFSWAIVGLEWAFDSHGCSNTKIVDATLIGAIVLMVFMFGGLLLIFCTFCSGYMEYCLEDLNCFKCLCCLFYYPCCYKGPPEDWVSTKYDHQQNNVDDGRSNRQPGNTYYAKHQPQQQSMNDRKQKQKQQPMMAMKVHHAQPVPLAEPVYAAPQPQQQQQYQQQYEASAPDSGTAQPMYAQQQQQQQPQQPQQQYYAAPATASYANESTNDDQQSAKPADVHIDMKEAATAAVVVGKKVGVAGLKLAGKGLGFLARKAKEYSAEDDNNNANNSNNQV